MDKGKKKRRTSYKNVYSPLKMTKELRELGEKDSRKIIVLTYVGVPLLVLLLGFMYQLKPGYIAAAAAYWILSVPQLIITGKRGQYELKRFEDANAYMVQVSQSFVSNKSIYRALLEARNTFPKGRMQDTISEALKYIDENMTADVRKAEGKALNMIEEAYDCEKMHQLHEFLMTAERRGGNCDVEFELLEKNRIIWEKTVMDYRGRLNFARIGVTVEFAMLIFICAFMLSKFPDYISINGSTVVQVLNTIQIICLGMIFKHVDRRLSDSLLQSQREMTKEKAHKAFAYVENYNPMQEFIKNVPFIAAAAVVGILIISISRNTVGVVIGILLICAALFKHTLTYSYTQYKIKTEIKNCFPRWLFDMILLLQNESVVMAIMKTEKNAPAVMQEELSRICKLLSKNPASADAFMSFFADYGISEIENTMRRLYSMSIGTGSKGEMSVIIDSNMEMLSVMEKNALKNKGDMTVVYTYLPMIPVAVSLMGYCIILLVTVFEHLLTRI